MITQDYRNGTSSGFRLRRPHITSSGYTAEVDPLVKSHLEELNRLLGKAVFQRAEAAAGEPAGAVAKADGKEAAVSKDEPDARRAREKPGPRGIRIHHLTELRLTPKRVPANSWAQNSLLDRINNTDEADELISLEQYIDTDGQLSELKYSFAGSVAQQKFTLPFNTNAVLQDYPAIRDYLVVVGAQRFGVQDLAGLTNVVMKNPLGARAIINYATISGARSRIELEQLAVPHANDDDSPIVAKLAAANLPLSELSFAASTDSVVDSFIFNSKEERLLDAVAAEIGPIPAAVRPALIGYIKHSPFPITAANAKFFVPQFLTQISANGGAAADPGMALAVQSAEMTDSDFEVDYLEDASPQTQVSAAAMKCASQLFYSMVIADEADVLNAVNVFTHKMAVRDGVEMNDTELRADLRLYVFEGKFAEVKPGPLKDKFGRVKWIRTGKEFQRTRPAERHMFYRQVFDWGTGSVTEDVSPNAEFKTVWKVLMLESARYLERAQASPHPETYVSRTNVMQAVEDLQYNLSAHAVGMASVIAPLIYKELEFVVHRILEHEVVMQRVLPEGGEWWRVAEALNGRANRRRPKGRMLNNKAKLGHAIINALASYNPATFEDDANFGTFISNVDAFITTQSILQEAVTDSLRKLPGSAGDSEPPANGNGNGNGRANGHAPDEDEDDVPAATMPLPGMGAAGGDGAAAGADEWDF